MGLTAVGLAGLGLSAYQGQKGVTAQRRGLQAQDEAEQRAKSAASSERIRSQTAINKADRKKPDIASLLASAQGRGKSGFKSTVLTGSGGLGQLGGIG